MSRDALDTALRKLALKVTLAALEDGETGKAGMDKQHDQRVETLKVAGNFASQAKRAKKANPDAPEDADEPVTITAVQARIAAAGKQKEGHA